jgi:hypothetical protein
VKGVYKREPEPAASPQSATPHSTGNISVNEGSCHSNTRGTVRLCSFPDPDPLVRGMDPDPDPALDPDPDPSIIIQK